MSKTLARAAIRAAWLNLMVGDQRCEVADALAAASSAIIGRTSPRR
jgi:hypothetical protein